MIGALGTTLCFACNAIFANRSAQRLGSNLANLARLVVATLLLGVWAHGLGAGLGGPAFGWFLVSGIAGFGIGGVAMFQALPRIGSPLAMLIVQCGSAVVAAAVEWMWLGTRLTVPQLSLVGITLSGVVLGLLSQMQRTQSALRSELGAPITNGAGVGDPGAGLTEAGNASGSHQVLVAGITWAIVSACGQGLGAVLSRKAFRAASAALLPIDAATTAYERALGGLLVAGLVVLVVRVWNRNPDRSARGPGARAWPWVVANAITGPVLGVTCFQWALRTTPAGIVQPIVATAPLLTIPLAMWLEHARPRALYYLGSIIAVTGVAGLFIAR